MRRKEGVKWNRLDDEQSTSSQQHIIKLTDVSVETSSADGDKFQDYRKDNEYPWEDHA